MARTRTLDLDVFRDLAPCNTAAQLAAHFEVRRDLIEEIAFVHAVPVLPDNDTGPETADTVMKMNRPYAEDLIRSGEMFTVIAAKFGVSRERIRQIAKEIGITGRDRQAARRREIFAYAEANGVPAASLTYKISVASVESIVDRLKEPDPVAAAEYQQRLTHALADLRAGHAFERTRTTYNLGAISLKAACEAEGIVLSRSRKNIARQRVALVEAMMKRHATVSEIYQAVLASESHAIAVGSFYGWLNKRGYYRQIAAYTRHRSASGG